MPRTQHPALITEERKDRDYFIITPQLVWALTHDPYELTLWTVIKMIAGEDGQCYLSTPDLATLSMQSTGKCTQCRQRLFEAGLLYGKIQKDPGYNQGVWHLRIPDLWPDNLRWRTDNHSLADRILYKRQQLADLKSSSEVQDKRSPGECLPKGSPDERSPSPDERSPSPGERSPSPGERKKNHLISKEEEEVWGKTQDLLHDVMTKEAHETWIQPARLDKIIFLDPTHHVQVSTPNAFVHDWLRARLDPIIKRALAIALDTTTQRVLITYSVKPKEQPPCMTT